jgi:hypothetical protein
MDRLLRLAREDDIPALEALIPISVRALQAIHYSPAQMEAALGTVFGVDRQLIRDGTYFVVECDGQIVGCGGWSKRNSLFGGDSGRSSEDALLNPERDSARIRAFFGLSNCTSGRIGRSTPGRKWLKPIDNFHKPRIAAKRRPGGIELELPVIGPARRLGQIS